MRNMSKRDIDIAKLCALHTQVADLFAKALSDKEVTNETLKLAIAFLKDNGITAPVSTASDGATPHAASAAKILKALPRFPDEDTGDDAA